MGLGSQTCTMASSGSMFKEEHMVAFWEWSPSAHGPWLPLAPSHDSQMVTDLPPGPGHTPSACAGSAAGRVAVPKAFPDCLCRWAPRSTLHTVSCHCLPQAVGRLDARPRVTASLQTLSRSRQHSPPTPARLSWEKLVPSWPQSGLPSVVCGNSTWRMCLWPPLEENGCWSAWRGRLGRGAASQPVNKRASATGARQVLPEYWALAAQPGSCPSAGWGRGPAHLRAVSFGAEINPEATPLPLAPTPQVEEGQFWDET